MTIDAAFVILRVQDMGRAMRFYRDGLGLEERFETPVFSEVATANTVIALEGGGKGEPRRSSLAFAVSDIDAACAAVEGAGGSVPTEPRNVQGDLWSAVACDTEGNAFALSSHQDEPSTRGSG